MKKLKFKYSVCKPCWELKYCPYGPSVEQSPLAFHDGQISEEQLLEVEKRYQEVLDAFRKRHFKSESEVLVAINLLLYLHPAKWRRLSLYDTRELECGFFGHICPVFLNGELVTETKERRRSGRHIPRKIMLQVVRRDGQVCQVCRKNVPEQEIEFDHLIPHSKGGPVSVENLRVLCRKCNSEKTDSLNEILEARQDESG